MKVKKKLFQPPLVKSVSFKIEKGLGGSYGQPLNTMTITSTEDELSMSSESNFNEQYDVIGNDGQNSWF